MREPADMSLPAPVAPGEQDVFHTVVRFTPPSQPGRFRTNTELKQAALGKGLSSGGCHNPHQKALAAKGHL